MLMKLLILLGAATMFILFVLRAARGVMGGGGEVDGQKSDTHRRIKTQDLMKCPRCGIFIPRDHTCDCSDPA